MRMFVAAFPFAAWHGTIAAPPDLIDSRNIPNNFTLCGKLLRNR